MIIYAVVVIEPLQVLAVHQHLHYQEDILKHVQAL